MLLARIIIFILVAGFGGQASAQAPAAAAKPATTNETCAGCHEQETKLKAGAHAAVACASCHVRHEEYPHPEGVAKPECGQCHEREAVDYAESQHGQEVKKGNAGAPDCKLCHDDVHSVARTKTAEFHKGVPDTCGMCHDKEAAEFNKSVHGKAVAQGIAEAPVCTNCHGAHRILPKNNPSSFVHPLAVRETCGNCHGDLSLNRRFGLPADRLTSFDTSFHGLAQKTGSQTVASCASCHGFHNILASTNPQSMTHPQQLAKTCGGCHPGAGSRFAIGRIHTVENNQTDPVKWAELFYLLVIPGTLGLMLLHHAGDFVRKVGMMRFSNGHSPVETLPASIVPGKSAPHLRMYRAERIQHVLLAVSFIVLVYTGFALRYSDSWWAKPMVHWETLFPVRGTVHRISGAILIGVSIAHMITLIVNRKLRGHWYGLFPKISDVREFMQGLAWRVGLTRNRPLLSDHSYVEKLEYWAVVWGSAVMALTGLLLWFNNWTLTYMPKQWIDFARAVHFYEAVLAAASILIWHFYMVIFDPEVYPMDPAWWTGRSPRRRKPHTGHDAPVNKVADHHDSPAVHPSATD